MGNKRSKPEEIVRKLRQIEFLTVQGIPRLDAIRQIPGCETAACNIDEEHLQ